MHAVQQLYQYRKSLSTTTFNARGKKVQRCEHCRVAQFNCICALKPNTLAQQQCQAGFVLLMYDTEVLKPSNTGRLIADIVPDTYAFLWSRTDVDTGLLALLDDNRWQPFVVFPEQYADEQQQLYRGELPALAGKRPLFILLDGSWREAKKMFRKSPYLAHLPVLSFKPEQIEAIALNGAEVVSGYQLRTASVNNQLATAEVAAKVLALAGEAINAQLLAMWFDVFSYRYQKSVCRQNLGDARAPARLMQFMETLNNDHSK